jgi:hypothetical protein
MKKERILQKDNWDKVGIKKFLQYVKNPLFFDYCSITIYLFPVI